MREKFVCPNTEQQQELNNCNFAKIILMLLVVLYHSMAFWTENWFCDIPAFQSTVLSFAAKWLNSFHIYTFTLISGYIFYYLQYECKKNYKTYGTLIRSKLRRLIVPYIFVSIVWVVPISAYFYHSTIKEMIFQYVLAIAPSQLWFLFMLFDVFLLFYPLSSVIDREPEGLLVIFGGYMIGILGEKFFPNIFQIWTSFRYLAYFAMGYKLRQHKSSWLRKIPIWVWLFCDVSIFSITQILMEYDGAFIKLINFALRNFANLWGAIAFFFILQSVAEHISWNRCRVLLALQRTSMPIYLFHQQIIYFVIRFLNGRVHPMLHMLINFGVSISASFLIASLLLKYKATKFLIGEK